jgi:hypothetical protein
MRRRFSAVSERKLVEQHRDEVVAVLQDGAELRADHAHEALLGRGGASHRLLEAAQAFGEALLHHGEENVLLGLEMIKRAAPNACRRARTMSRIVVPSKPFSRNSFA